MSCIAGLSYVCLQAGQTREVTRMTSLAVIWLSLLLLLLLLAGNGVGQSCALGGGNSYVVIWLIDGLVTPLRCRPQTEDVIIIAIA